MVHVTNDFDFDSTIKALVIRVVFIALASLFLLSLGGRSTSARPNAGKEGETTIELGAPLYACTFVNCTGARFGSPTEAGTSNHDSAPYEREGYKYSTVASSPVSAPLQQLLTKQGEGILKRLHTRKPKGGGCRFNAAKLVS